MVKTIQLSSLAKVFSKKIYGSKIKTATVARGQSFYYQIALKGKGAYTFEIDSKINNLISVSHVGFVPMTTPTYESCRDSDYLTKKKGNCPDPLFPLEGNSIELTGGYTSIWLCVEIPTALASGVYDITVKVFNKKGKRVSDEVLNLNVMEAMLPEQELIFTQWFHTDCIADVHNVDVFSEEHWALIEKYIALAASHGMNMILVPVLTPPLDTEVGGERTTVQLVKIVKNGEKYDFDFSQLNRFIDICLKCGIKLFEINHMFTQWGAKNAPKVIATVEGKEEKIFGWDTVATSEEYVGFLNQLIPSIIDTFVTKGIKKDRLYFHVSDEPGGGCINEYGEAYRIIEGLIDGCHQIDALSNFGFYEKGIIKTPIVATNAIKPFLDANVENLWCYYCCAQHEKVSNRFMAMPSYRNRIIGVQMYKCSIVGFLHWGYNFYNLQYSKAHINPYEVTDAGGSFPSGDSFSVYPFENAVIPSIRLKVFKNALEDVSLLKLAEQKIGKEAVNNLIDRVAGMEVTFESYPKTEDFFTKLYEEIFKILS
ncbi:MAG: DUF4091 domain-containing protein [Clostridia bacterium]|nr:DUF4091 domain-containing protein [Clostridia bacterium]